jgi:hypothetical protein
LRQQVCAFIGLLWIGGPVPRYVVHHHVPME